MTSSNGLVLVISESDATTSAVVTGLRGAGIEFVVHKPNEAGAVVDECRVIIWAAEGRMSPVLRRFLGKAGRPAVLVVGVAGGEAVRELIKVGPDAVASIASCGGAVIEGLLRAACDRRQLLERVAELERIHDFMFDRADALCVVIDATGAVVEISRSLCRLIGRDRRDVVGRPALDFVAPHTRARAAELIAADFRAEATPPMELDVPTPDGRIAHILFSSEWLPITRGKTPAILYTGSDVTAQRRVERELEASERTWRQLADTAPALLYVYDVQKHANVYANRSLTAVLGYSPEEVRAHGEGFLYSILHPDDWPATLVKLDRLQASAPGETIASEFRMLHKDGAYRWLEARESVLLRDARGAMQQITGVVIDATERRAQAGALEDSERKFRELAETAPVKIFILDDTGGCTYVNRHWLEYVGAALEDELGDGAYRHIHPDDIEPLRQAMVQSAARRRVWTCDARCRSKDGEYRWFFAKGAPRFDADGRLVGFIGCSVDVDDERRAVAALRDAEAAKTRAVHLQVEVLDALPAAIALVDQQGVVLMVNAGWRKFVDQYLSTVVGVRVGENYIEACRRGDVCGSASAQAADRIASAVAGEGHAFDTEYVCRKFGEYWFDLQVSPVRTGDVVGAIIMHLDITDRKLAEKALRSSEEQLRHSQKLEAIGVLASGVAHDFNNLISAIRGHTSLARASLPQEHPALDSLEQVEEASRQAVGVASSLLTFARKTRAEKSPVHLPSTVDAAARLFRRMLPPGVTLQLDTARAAGVWVHADPVQIQQVVTNLLLNARDAVGASGRVSIIAEPAPAGDPLDRPTPSARIIVRDTGPGMTKDVRARIFEPFFTTKARGHGTGLGLAVTHSIVQDHNGRIDVDAEPGHGTTFTITLPTVPAPADLGPLPHLKASGVPHAALVVSDNQLIRGLLASMLTGLGFEVEQAVGADQAIDALASATRRPTLLVTEEAVAGTSGLELVNAARLADQSVRGVIVTRNGLDPSIDPSLVAVLRKPFQMSDLRAVLAGLYAHEPADQAAREVP